MSKERIEEIYRHSFPFPTDQLTGYQGALLIAVRGLGEMVIELAEMIKGQEQDLDNAIEQANKQSS